MIKVLVGGDTAEKVLLYLTFYGEGYGQAIASTFDVSLSMVQKQLVKFEAGGILVSRLRGRVRFFEWNSKYPLRSDLLRLLRSNLELVPKKDKQKYFKPKKTTVKSR